MFGQIMRPASRFQNEKCYILPQLVGWASCPSSFNFDFNFKRSSTGKMPVPLISPMEIYLLRHGIAVERGAPGFENDSARPLTSKGKKQLKKVSEAMKKMSLNFAVILSSPFLRAKQTAEIIAADLKLKKRLKFSDALTPESDVKNFIVQLQKLKPLPKKILLVGHEPFSSGLISLLVTGDFQLQLDFKKSGLCKLEIKKLSVGKCATLAWLLTPKQMKLMR
jgi:phosphohistidine phosphatase